MKLSFLLQDNTASDPAGPLQHYFLFKFYFYNEYIIANLMLKFMYLILALFLIEHGII
jgi:hypothetical protein